MRNIEIAYHKMSKNFMTPKVLDVQITHNRVVELSTGEGIGGETIYGVSEFIFDGTFFDKTSRGQMVRTRKAASQYYKIVANSLPE